MGQAEVKGRYMTHVANGYDRDIRACVKANRIEVYDDQLSTKAKVGLPNVAAGVSLDIHQKRNFVTQDPGFTTIKPGGYFGFAESGPDGHVFVTIQIGSEIPHANIQVFNNSNVLVDNQGSLRNVKYKKIWTDTSGQKHNAPDPAPKEVSPVKEEETVQIKAPKEKEEPKVSPAKKKEKVQVKAPKEKQEVQKQSKKKSKKKDKDADEEPQDLPPEDSEECTIKDSDTNEEPQDLPPEDSEECTIKDSDSDEVVDELTNESDDSGEESEIDIEPSTGDWQPSLELVDTQIISLATGLFSKVLEHGKSGEGSSQACNVVGDILATESEDSDEDIVINDETSAEELQQDLSFADKTFFSLARRLFSRDPDRKKEKKNNEKGNKQSEESEKDTSQEPDNAEDAEKDGKKKSKKKGKDTGDGPEPAEDSSKDSKKKSKSKSDTKEEVQKQSKKKSKKKDKGKASDAGEVAEPQDATPEDNEENSAEDSKCDEGAPETS